MRSMHAQARAAQNHFDEFRRLVAVRNDPNWATPKTVAEATGRPVTLVPADLNNTAAAARRVMDQALTEAISECLAAGVTRAVLTDNRGWLSIADLNRMAGHASEPRAETLRAGWPQDAALAEVRKTLATLASERRSAEADRLARSSRSFLRQWTTTIPTTPPAEVADLVAVAFRREHAKAWKKARTDLLADIRELGAKQAQSRVVTDRTPQA